MIIDKLTSCIAKYKFLVSNEQSVLTKTCETMAGVDRKGQASYCHACTFSVHHPCDALVFSCSSNSSQGTFYMPRTNTWTTSIGLQLINHKNYRDCAVCQYFAWTMCWKDVQKWQSCTIGQVTDSASADSSYGENQTTEHRMAAERRRRSCTGDCNQSVPWTFLAAYCVQVSRKPIPFIPRFAPVSRVTTCLLTYLLLANIHAWYDWIRSLRPTDVTGQWRRSVVKIGGATTR